MHRDTVTVTRLVARECSILLSESHEGQLGLRAVSQRAPASCCTHKLLEKMCQWVGKSLGKRR